MYKASKSQKRQGLVMSYLGSTANVLATVFLTPFLISRLDVVGFGLYQMATAFAAYLVILNLGMRLMVTREVAQAVLEGDQIQLAERLGILLRLLGLTLVLLSIGASITYLLLDEVFGASLDAAQLQSVAVMFWLTVLNLAGQFIGDVALGILGGFELFKVAYGIPCLRLAARFAAMFGVVAMGSGPVGVVAADAVVSVFLFAPTAWYLALRLAQVRIRFSGYDSRYARRCLAFGGALALGTMSFQVNFGLSKVVLGALAGPVPVSVYAVAVSIYTGFATITMSLGQLFVPSAVKVVRTSSTRVQTTEFVARPARLQLVIGALALIVFVLYGQAFLRAWVGPGFESAWLAALLLLIPSLFASVEISALAVLDAHRKRLVRSLLAVGAAVLSLGLTIILVPSYGVVGAALACGLGILCSDVLLLNIYYHKYINIDVILLSQLVLRGTGKVILCTTALFLPIALLAPDAGMPVVLQFVAFVVVYSAGMYFFGFLPWERDEVRRLGRTCRMALGALPRRI